MSHSFKGIAIIFIAAYLLWVAYNSENKSNKGFWAIVLLGFFLRLFVSSDPFLHDWDERYHALVAKSLMQDILHPLLHTTTVFDYDFKDWTNNYVWLHKPPLSLWMMASSMHFFGVNEFALRLPSVILSTLSIALTYQIALRLYPENKNIGLLAAFFQSINGFVIEISGGRIPTDHVDTLLLFWIELGVWFSVRQSLSNAGNFRLLLIVFITSLAVLTKWLVALFIPFLFFSFELLDKKRTLFISIGRSLFIGVISMILPAIWANYAYSKYPAEYSWEQSLNARHLYEVIEGHSGEWWYYLDRARIHWNEGIYLIFLWFVFTVFSNWKKNDVFLFVWAVVPYLLFSGFATKMNGYVLIASPAIFIIISKFVVFSWKKNTNTWKALSVLVVLLSLRYCIERVKPFYRNPDGIAQIEMINKIKSIMPDKDDSIVFNNSFYIETMFYTNIASRRGIPTQNEVSIAKQHFKNITIVNIENNLPDWILQDTAIIIINFPL